LLQNNRPVPAGSATSRSRNATTCGSSPVDFSADRVAEWLRNDMGYLQHGDTFLAERVTGASMSALSEWGGDLASRALEDCGVERVVHQANVMGGWAKLERACGRCEEENAAAGGSNQ
jgi:hypothetical protein